MRRVSNASGDTVFLFASGIERSSAWKNLGWGKRMVEKGLRKKVNCENVSVVHWLEGFHVGVFTCIAFALDSMNKIMAIYQKYKKL